MASYTIQRGDTMPLRVVLRRTTGQAIDLGVGVGQADVDFVMKPARSNVALIDRPCVVLQAEAVPGIVTDKGVVEFFWLPGETAAPGVFRVHYRVTDVAGDVEYVPNKGAFDLVIE